MIGEREPRSERPVLTWESVTIGLHTDWPLIAVRSFTSSRLVPGRWGSEQSNS